MVITVQIEKYRYQIDLSKPLSIAIPLNFNQAQPNVFAVETATAQNLGDTRHGASCNFEQIKFTPHCNGTHTECVGHITHQRIGVHDCLRDAFIFAALVTIEPENANETTETYAVKFGANDKIITKRAIETAFPKTKDQRPKTDALIIRTLPNDESKKTRVYSDNVPPYFSSEAIEFIVANEIKHLLVDAPSIDRTFDEGKLSNHRRFWNVRDDEFALNDASRIDHTITELIFVPDEIADGFYLLNLQIAPFASDAAPSRPILFQIG